MIEKTSTLQGLPIGTGAAIGNYIRSLYLTAAKRYAIIGVEAKGLGFFDTLGANSAMVSDLILLLVSDDYTINPGVINDSHKVTDTASFGAIYAAHCSNNFTKEITRQHFSSVIIGDSTASIKLITPVALDITFYICEVTGLAKENLVSAALHELPVDSTGVLPIACSGKHVSRVWSTCEQHQFTEDLTIHIAGPSEEVVSSDLNFLKELYASYTYKSIDCLNDFK